MGLNAAKYCNHVGRAVIGTNAFDKNVNGKIQIRPAVLAVSVFGTDNPTKAPTQVTVYAKSSNSRYARMAFTMPSLIRHPTMYPVIDKTVSTST